MSEIIGGQRLSFRNTGAIRIGALLIVCMISAGLFLMYSSQNYKIGFPLDDAWIHQTYARNLIQLKQWVYVPGEVSTGSTSPLWTLLLSVGYWFQQTLPYFWTYALGILGLFGVALAGERIFAQWNNHGSRALPLAGLFLATEWHLIWGAVSGMETILFAFMILAVFACLVQTRPQYLLAGTLIGVACWVRPDGITLLGPAFFILILMPIRNKEKLKKGLFLIAGFSVIFGGYLLFNYLLGGAILPNTYFAKQAEYASLLNQPLWKRFSSLAALPAIGAGSLLIPGFLVALWKSIKQRDWNMLALFLWWAGDTAIYALRLPVSYQHGRYLIPAMPVFFIIGLIGTSQILKVQYTNNRIVWAYGKLILVSLIAVQLIFGIKGATAYAEDVAIIESEMVETAFWLNENTEVDAVIAVHDIGAIGYFSQRQLLDLAGLVSPEVIPFIRDEARLAQYLEENKASYLVTFPDWYPELVDQRIPVFQTDSAFTRRAGEKNMCVYRWND